MNSRPRTHIIRNLYKKVGGNPEEIVIDPPNEYASLYEVKKEDSKPVTILRRYFEDENIQEIEHELKKLL